MSDRPDPIPDDLLRFPTRGEDFQSWRRRLPRLAGELVDEWRLTPDGLVTAGECAAVLGVTTEDGSPAALKIGWPHWEAEHEHLALRAWGGDGAVRLLRADPSRSALLLERCHPTDLRGVEVITACRIVAGFYPRLHRAPLPQLRRLSDQAARWADELLALPAAGPIPHRLVDRAAALARDFAADPATDSALIHTDLHYENVLAADREPYLVIDPKPLAGDPAYEVAPLLWNRWPEAIASGSVRAAVRARAAAVVEVAGLDEDRVRDWTIVRMLVNAAGGVDERFMSARDWVTLCVTGAKAVQ